MGSGVTRVSAVSGDHFSATMTPAAAGTGRLPADETETELEILVIEDEFDHADLVEQMLARGLEIPHRIARFETLESAREAVRETDGLIILDLGLPDTDGLETLQAIQELNGEVPVVVYSATDGIAMAGDAVRRGAQDFLVKGHADGHALARSVAFAVERKRVELELAHLANHDPVTGLPNRAGLYEALRSAIARTTRSGASVGLLFIDMDNFKAINDTWGHEIGDRALKTAAARMGECVRDGDLLARLHGDEFAILCDGVAGPHELEPLARRLAERLKGPARLGPAEVSLSASIGIAISDAAIPVDELIGLADGAMYEAKRDPLSAYSFAAELPAPRPAREMISLGESPIGELLAGFEPLYDAAERHLIGGEIVACRRGDDGASVLGLEESAMAELDAITMVELGFALIRAAFAEIPDSLSRLNFNVTLPAKVLTDERMLPGLADGFGALAIRPQCLGVLIGGGLSAASLPGLATLAEELRGHGIRVGIDGLGGERASIVAFDKIGPQFARLDPRICRSGAGGRIRAAAAGVADAYSLETIAAGIEDDATAAELVAVGCDVVQGYPLPGPLTIEQFLAAALPG